jgi:hypothetical protein
MPIKDSKIIEAFSEKSQIELVPGGCSYNTMRVLNVKKITKIKKFF